MPTMYNYCPTCKKELREAVVDGVTRLVCPDENCQFVLWGNPVPVVAGIVEIPSGVVLTRNAEWPPGWWGLVTGFLERGETPEQGIVREVKEELGLTASLESFVGIYSFFRRNQLIIAYHLTASGEMVVGDELEAVKVVALDKLEPWAGATGTAVKDWLERRG